MQVVYKVRLCLREKQPNQLVSSSIDVVERTTLLNFSLTSHNRPADQWTDYMKPIEISRAINAPIESVFQTVSDVRNFREAVPHITKIEFVTDQQVGQGTRFRETRSMNGREHTIELEVAEYLENDRVRMISDAGGTVWDTLFRVKDEHGSVKLEMTMDIKPHKLLAKIMMPMIKGMVAKRCCVGHGCCQDIL